LSKSQLSRISVSLPSTLVDEFDNTWRNMKYRNRSKAIHDAIRGFITDVQSSELESSFVVGTILVLHYLDKTGLIEDVKNIQHKFKDIISAIQQTYIEENKMLEVIQVNGHFQEIERLMQDLMAKKGVKEVKMSVVAP
jgi:CopG family nickel-responsive transcriptional regulator